MKLHQPYGKREHRCLTKHILLLGAKLLLPKNSLSSGAKCYTGFRPGLTGTARQEKWTVNLHNWLSTPSLTWLTRLDCEPNRKEMQRAGVGLRKLHHWYAITTA